MSKLKVFVASLVNEYKIGRAVNEYYLNVDQLPLHAINNFVIMLLHVEPEFLQDSTLFYEPPFRSALIKLFRRPDIDEKCWFSDVVMEMLYKIYEKRMQDLINDALNDL